MAGLECSLERAARSQWPFCPVSQLNVCHPYQFLFCFFLSSAFDWAFLFLFQHHIAAIVRLFPPFFLLFFVFITMIWVYSGVGGGGVKIEVDGLTGLLKAVLDSGRSLIGRRYFRTASNVFRVSSSR